MRDETQGLSGGTADAAAAAVASTASVARPTERLGRDGPRPGPGRAVSARHRGRCMAMHTMFSIV